MEKWKKKTYLRSKTARPVGYALPLAGWNLSCLDPHFILYWPSFTHGLSCSIYYLVNSSH